MGHWANVWEGAVFTAPDLEGAAETHGEEIVLRDLRFLFELRKFSRARDYGRHLEESGKKEVQEHHEGLKYGDRYIK